MKTVALIVWFLVCAAAWVLLCYNFIWDTNIHKGTDIPFSTGMGQYFVVEGEDIKFEAGSCQPFALYSATEAVGSVPSKSPLGGNCSEYHYAVKEPFHAGKWIMASGGPEINLTSEKEMLVKVTRSGAEMFMLSVLIFLCVAVVFVLGCAFEDEVLELPDRMPNWLSNRQRGSSSSTSHNRR